MIALRDYEAVAQAVIAAAGRVRGRAVVPAVESAQRARAFLGMSDAMAPWVFKEGEPECDDEGEPGPLAVSAELRRRRGDERCVEILRAVPPGRWVTASEIAETARLGRPNTHYHCREMVEQGLLLMRQSTKAGIVAYARAAGVRVDGE
jgi:hypothetical protein